MKKKIDILFEDEMIVVINKPPNFLTIPDRFKDLPNLLSFLQKKYENIFTVHRLDKETSGVVVFAKTAEAHAILSKQFEKREVKKIYHALVEGVFFDKKGLIDKPIAPSQSRLGKMIVHQRGKPSQTKFEVKEEFKHHSYLEIELLTGRQHQIRVHFAALGHPLLVDKLYNKDQGFYLSSIKRKYKSSEEERPLMDRLSLHAGYLEFDHPKTNERLVFEAELPKDFKAVIKQLSKWSKT